MQRRYGLACLVACGNYAVVGAVAEQYGPRPASFLGSGSLTRSISPGWLP
jgi:hypothetical protein